MKKIYYLLSATLLLLGACKKSGPIEYPGFGTLKLQSNASTPNVNVSFILKVDDVTIDTLKSTESYQKELKLQTGKRKITISNSKNANVVYSNTVTIDLGTTVTLPSFLIQNEALLADDYDPAVIKPSPGKMLVRFIITDPTLPDQMNIKIKLRYISYSDGLPTSIDLNKEVRAVSKTSFSAYVELGDPLGFDPNNVDGYSYIYAIEGWDAVTNTQVMSVPGRTYGTIRYDITASPSYIPDNVVTLAIPPSATGTTHIGKVLFQKQL